MMHAHTITRQSVFRLTVRSSFSVHDSGPSFRRRVRMTSGSRSSSSTSEVLSTDSAPIPMVESVPSTFSSERLLTAKSVRMLLA